MKRLVLPIVLLVAGPALAQPAPASPEATQAALAQMLRDAQEREAGALIQVYALRQQVTAEKRRADDAEAKCKGAPSAGEK